MNILALGYLSLNLVVLFIMFAQKAQQTKGEKTERPFVMVVWRSVARRANGDLSRRPFNMYTTLFMMSIRYYHQRKLRIDLLFLSAKCNINR